MNHPWMPCSPCGDGCLPSAVLGVGAARQAWRLCAVAAVLLAGVMFAPSLLALPTPARERLLRRWFRALLAALQVRIEVIGGSRFAGRREAVLVVSNHVSWLDIAALNAVQPLRMVAKSEVAGWALIGPLSRHAGTLYVDRDRLSTLPATVAAMTLALRAGAAVGVFPEATTWCGRIGGRFRPAPFQAALDAGAAVRPVALRYRLDDTGAPTTVASFVGSATLWRSAAVVVRVRGLVVQVRLFPTIEPAGDRRTLAAAAAAAVEASTLRTVGRTHRVPQWAADPGRGGVPA